MSDEGDPIRGMYNGVKVGCALWIFAFALAGFIAYVVKPWLIGLMQ